MPTYGPRSETSPSLYASTSRFHDEVGGVFSDCDNYGEDSSRLRESLCAKTGIDSSRVQYLVSLAPAGAVSLPASTQAFRGALAGLSFERRLPVPIVLTVAIQSASVTACRSVQLRVRLGQS